MYIFWWTKVLKRRLAGGMDSAQWCNWQKGEKQSSLSACLSAYLCRLTFHTEFGAPAVFVDENKKDKEEDASETRQTHGDGNLREMKCFVRLCSHHNPLQISDHLKYCKSQFNPLDCDYCFLTDYSSLEKSSTPVSAETYSSWQNVIWIWSSSTGRLTLGAVLKPLRDT